MIGCATPALPITQISFHVIRIQFVEYANLECPAAAQEGDEEDEGADDDDEDGAEVDDVEVLIDFERVQEVAEALAVDEGVDAHPEGGTGQREDGKVGRPDDVLVGAAAARVHLAHSHDDGGLLWTLCGFLWIILCGLDWIALSRLPGSLARLSRANGSEGF